VQLVLAVEQSGEGSKVDHAGSMRTRWIRR
jgi:hypothetical protein